MSAFKEEIDAGLAARLGRDLGVPVQVGDLAGLELKDRVVTVSEALYAGLGEDWLERLVDTFEGADLGSLRGWPILRVIEDHGTERPVEALEAIRRLTPMFSGEFAVRPHLIADPDGTLAIMKGWTSDPSEHVRRLASEGARPRLPWGQRLPAFVADPRPLFPLLEPLLDDRSAYVRRSVANHLNDISKDHPALVVEVLGRWARPGREKLVRRALRSLVKSGDLGALALIGVGEPELSVVRFEVEPRCRIGESVGMLVELACRAEQKLVVDYAVGLVGRKGRRRKVFKWSTRQVRPGRVVLERRHPMRPVSVRRLYPGEHTVELQINGRSFGTRPFQLTEA